MTETGQERELTFGEKAVGLKFNPSGDNDVDRCKKQFADIIDLLHNLRSEATDTGKMRHLSTAITMCEDAQMRAVKGITRQS